MRRGDLARPRQRTPGRLLLDLVLTALLVTAVAASSYALTSAPARTVESAVLAAPSPTADPVTSLWFGDSFAAGCCRSDPELPSMAEVAAARWGWAEPQVVDERGTGYLSARRDEQGGAGAYTERIEAAVDGASYDVVVLFGGDDDEEPFDTARFRSAARTVLMQVRTSLPSAQIVVMLPTDVDAPGADEQRQVLREEAVRAGAAWFDPVAEGWTANRPQWLAEDGYHVNDAGHVGLGGLVADAFRRTLPDRLTTGAVSGD